MYTTSFSSVLYFVLSYLLSGFLCFNSELIACFCTQSLSTDGQVLTDSL